MIPPFQVFLAIFHALGLLEKNRSVPTSNIEKQVTCWEFEELYGNIRWNRLSCCRRYLWVHPKLERTYNQIKPFGFCASVLKHSVIFLNLKDLIGSITKKTQDWYGWRRIIYIIWPKGLPSSHGMRGSLHGSAQLEISGLKGFEVWLTHWDKLPGTQVLQHGSL